MPDIKIRLSDNQVTHLDEIANSFGMTRQKTIQLLISYYYDQVMPSNEIAVKTLEAK